MRTSPRQGNPIITAIFGGVNAPIRMHLCGITYRMSADEALEMATMLADSVQDLKNGKPRILMQEE